jgi:hypothetical protein
VFPYILGTVNRFTIVLLLAALPLGTVAATQDNPPATHAKKPQPDDKFSGTITQLTADSLTVVRMVPARDAVTRTFALDAKTRIEGHLRVQARVTVQYESPEDGQYRATRIIVK